MQRRLAGAREQLERGMDEYRGRCEVWKAESEEKVLQLKARCEASERHRWMSKSRLRQWRTTQDVSVEDDGEDRELQDMSERQQLQYEQLWQRQLDAQRQQQQQQQPQVQPEQQFLQQRRRESEQLQQRHGQEPPQQPRDHRQVQQLSAEPAAPTPTADDAFATAWMRVPGTAAPTAITPAATRRSSEEWEQQEARKWQRSEWSSRCERQQSMFDRQQLAQEQPRQQR